MRLSREVAKTEKAITAFDSHRRTECGRLAVLLTDVLEGHTEDARETLEEVRDTLYVLSDYLPPTHKDETE